MRHIILGSDTTIGSSIVRLLTSIRAENVIAVSNLGELPSGVDPKKATAIFGDMTDLYTINDLFEEGDIVYYCQIVRDESAHYKDAELYNIKGFIDLLGFATDANVEKIVCALPQALGYRLPKDVFESDEGRSHSPVQKSVLKLREIAKKYNKGEDFGFKQSTLNELRKIEQEEVTVSTEPSLKGTPSSGPSLKGTPSSGPSLKGTPSSGPSLKGTPSSGPEDQSEVTESSDDVEDEEIDKSETEVEEIVEEPEEEIFEYEPVPLVLGRIARLFGPFEEKITPLYCKSIRLQKIEVYGKINKQITWIHPIDAGRAMIIMGDTSVGVQGGEYNINGFVASPLDILNMLDEINHSNIEITHKKLILPFIKHVFISFINFLGFKINDPYYQHLSLNRRQVFDGTKAEKGFGWEPKFDMIQTLKEAMNWFISHKL